MDQRNAASADQDEVTSILAILEQQLQRLDAIGAGIAAAHLDATIQQLRLDRINLEQNQTNNGAESTPGS